MMHLVSAQSESRMSTFHSCRRSANHNSTKPSKATPNSSSAPFISFLSAACKTTTAIAVIVVVLAASCLQSTNAHSLADNSIHDSSSSQYQRQPLEKDQQYNVRSQHRNSRLPSASLNLLAASAPVAQQQQQNNYNRCQPGWMWFNNKCWVTTQSRRDHQHAIELCKKMYNSTLPTIHSEDENEFLKQNIDLSNSPIWLFARHNHQYNKTRWLDKSLVNYTRWDAGQPSDKSSLVCIKTEESWYMRKAENADGQTECVSFWNDAKWGTQVGCQVLLPVVCEKKLAPVSRFQDGMNNSLASNERLEVGSPSNTSGAQKPIVTINYILAIASISSFIIKTLPSILVV